jgi:hypothetical protein
MTIIQPASIRRAEIESRLAAIEREKQELSQELDAILNAKQAEGSSLTIAHPQESAPNIPAHVYGRSATHSPLTSPEERIAYFH